MIKAQNISPLGVIAGLVALLTAYIIYNIFFHPLRHYPGPWYTKGTRLWFIIKVFQGTVVCDIKKLHDKYGDVVRVAPNELSYTNPDAWQEIYGRNVRQMVDDHKETMIFKKDPIFYSGVLAEAKCYADIDGEPYRIQKKAILGGLTKKANLLQEEVLQEGTARFVESLRPSSLSKSSFDILPYIQNTAMDVIVRLICGHDLEAVKSGHELHSTAETTDRAFRLSVYYLQFRRLSSFLTDPLENVLGKLTMRFGMLDYMDFVTPLVQARMQTPTAQPDMVSYMLPHLEKDEIMKNSIMLTLAGSDSTISVLAATIYFLLSNPAALQHAQEEVRTRFQAAEDITIESTEQKLEYLPACITEATRLFPPFWGAAPREVPAGGAEICGKYVPGGSTVAIYHWAMYQSSQNFREPGKFWPERWIGDKDEKESKSYHPFSVGPRTCIGKETSLLLTRLMMAHLVWAYDFELSKESIGNGWERPPAYMAPTKFPLFVKLRARN